ncbi:MAG TPA: hypothetical protein VHA75_18070 [Rugosimonospora sp.]|uniref:hypothetical protein n=1 Tax=Actinomadura sp. TaxID=1989 RepID=UPI002CAEA21D|nr:hypothetical protein [Rugosimonospora sp.]
MNPGLPTLDQADEAQDHTDWLCARVAVTVAVTNHNSRSRHPENRRWQTPFTIRKSRWRPESPHTYYVLASETPVLVHNRSCGVARNEKGQFTSGENADAARGRQTHLNYRNALGAGYDFEVTLPSGLRPDAVDWKNRVVRELKSDAKSSQATAR